MVVLARRANGILVVAPLVLLFLGVVLYYSVMLVSGEMEVDAVPGIIYSFMRFFDGLRRSYRKPPEVVAFWTYLSVAFIAVPLFVEFLSRLFVPKIIMECDDNGVYIYHGKKQVTVLRYEYLWSHYTEEDTGGDYLWVKRGMLPVPEFLYDFEATGSMRIETPDGFINLRGIYHVREVERELKTRIRKQKLEYERFLEEGVREARVDREKTKHDT